MEPLTMNWFWAAAILVMCANAGVFHLQARKHYARYPELEPGYRYLIRGFLIWGNIPWLIMGAGHLVGGITSIEYFLRPRTGNPFVLAFLASVLWIWAGGTIWLFRGGAELLAKHYAMFNIRNPKMIKGVWLLCLASGISALVGTLTQDMPLFVR